jgi:hypothetical protein
MVHYMATRGALQEAFDQPQSADLMAELTAMRTIANALTELSDVHTRLRVLKWAECFSAAPGAPAAPPAPAVQPTPFLPALLQSRRQDATLTLDGFDVFGDEASDETEQTTLRAAEEPLELMIKGLVADVQQIARDWHGE